MKNVIFHPKTRIFFLFAIFFTGFGEKAFTQNPGKEETIRYNIHIVKEDTAATLSGFADYSATPSSITIAMHNDLGKCALHLLNFSSFPEPGTYPVTHDPGDISAALVCVMDSLDTRERMVSESGTFTLLEIKKNALKGTFDMVLVGALTQKKYRFTGEIKKISK